MIGRRARAAQRHNSQHDHKRRRQAGQPKRRRCASPMLSKRRHYSQQGRPDLHPQPGTNPLPKSKTALSIPYHLFPAMD